VYRQCTGGTLPSCRAVCRAVLGRRNAAGLAQGPHRCYVARRMPDRRCALRARRVRCTGWN